MLCIQEFPSVDWTRLPSESQTRRALSWPTWELAGSSLFQRRPGDTETAPQPKLTAHSRLLRVMLQPCCRTGYYCVWECAWQNGNPWEKRTLSLPLRLRAWNKLWRRSINDPRRPVDVRDVTTTMCGVDLMLWEGIWTFLAVFVTLGSRMTAGLRRIIFLHQLACCFLSVSSGCTAGH